MTHAVYATVLREQQAILQPPIDFLARHSGT
jgi:hypothetical protein